MHQQVKCKLDYKYFISQQIDMEIIWRTQEGYEVALFEGLNSMHSSKTQLLLGVPSENSDWSTVLQIML